MQSSNQKHGLRVQVSSLTQLPNILEAAIEERQIEKQRRNTTLNRYLQISHVYVVPYRRVHLEVARSQTQNRVMLDPFHCLPHEKFTLLVRLIRSLFLLRVAALLRNCREPVKERTASHDQQQCANQRSCHHQGKSAAFHSKVPKRNRAGND